MILRDKEHKRYKDVCDITALCLFAGIPVNGIIKAAKNFVSKEKLEKFRKMNFKTDITNCSDTLGLELNIVKSVLDKIKEK